MLDVWFVTELDFKVSRLKQLCNKNLLGSGGNSSKLDYKVIRGNKVVLL